MGKVTKGKLSDFRPLEGNPNQHTERGTQMLDDAMGEVGYTEAMTSAADGEMLSGSLRLETAIEKFGDDVIVVETDGKTPIIHVRTDIPNARTRLARRAIVGANRIHAVDFLEDADVMAAMLAEDESIFEGLYGDDELEELLGDLLKGEEVEDPGARINEADALAEKWGTALGQVWELGEHRLAVGDCTDPQVVEAVMRGEKAQLAVTSPPYGVGKSYETKGIGPWFDTVRPAIQLLCQNANVVAWNLIDLYSTGSQFIEPTMAYSVSMFMEQGYRPLWIRMWLKQGQNHGVGPYHLVSNKPVQQYEYMAAFGEDNDALALLREDVPDVSDFEWMMAFANGKHRFVRRLSKRERKEWGYSGVWQINTVRQNKEHPAMFPLELPERCIKMHSGVGDSVLDPFLGSGTTLIGCERLGRKGRGIELDEGYAAVAIDRWATMTNGAPRLLA